MPIVDDLWNPRDGRGHHGQSREHRLNDHRREIIAAAPAFRDTCQRKDLRVSKQLAHFSLRARAKQAHVLLQVCPLNPGAEIGLEWTVSHDYTAAFSASLAEDAARVDKVCESLFLHVPTDGNDLRDCARSGSRRKILEWDAVKNPGNFAARKRILFLGAIAERTQSPSR